MVYHQLLLRWLRIDFGNILIISLTDLLIDTKKILSYTVKSELLWKNATEWIFTRDNGSALSIERLYRSLAHVLHFLVEFSS